jgi:hypothetical protein
VAIRLHPLDQPRVYPLCEYIRFCAADTKRDLDTEGPISSSLWKLSWHDGYRAILGLGWRLIQDSELWLSKPGDSTF